MAANIKSDEEEIHWFISLLKQSPLQWQKQ